MRLRIVTIFSSEECNLTRSLYYSKNRGIFSESSIIVKAIHLFFCHPMFFFSNLLAKQSSQGTYMELMYNMYGVQHYNYDTTTTTWVSFGNFMSRLWRHCSLNTSISYLNLPVCLPQNSQKNKLLSRL